MGGQPLEMENAMLRMRDMPSDDAIKLAHLKGKAAQFWPERFRHFRILAARVEPAGVGEMLVITESRRRQHVFFRNAEFLDSRAA